MALRESVQIEMGTIKGRAECLYHPKIAKVGGLGGTRIILSGTRGFILKRRYQGVLSGGLSNNHGFRRRRRVLCLGGYVVEAQVEMRATTPEDVPQVVEGRTPIFNGCRTTPWCGQQTVGLQEQLDVGFRFKPTACANQMT